MRLARLIGLMNGDTSYKHIVAFHNQYSSEMAVARGSNVKHQAWEGGYADHIAECLRIAWHMYKGLREIRPLPFELSSACKVLYFHDIEKIWKYGHNKPPFVAMDKMAWYHVYLPQRGICFSNEEVNAFTHIHGEVGYGQDRRMGGLGAFCHSCDVLSARMWWNYGRGD